MRSNNIKYKQTSNIESTQRMVLDILVEEKITKNQVICFNRQTPS